MHLLRPAVAGCLVLWTSLPAALSAQTAPAVASGSASATAPAAAFRSARALYYTPVDQGLEGFHCEVSFDWKDFIQKASNQAVPDDDARLAYLRSIQLSIDDNLDGTGELHWTAPAPPPDGTEDSVGKIRDGFQKLWSGFFQAWNGFFTGDMVSLDAKSTVERTATGYHVQAQNGPGLAEEQYDNKLLLQRMHVSTPAMDSVVLPVFTPSPRGLLVSSLHSTYRQPPGADPVDIQMRVSYSPVATFQIPSEMSVVVGPAAFDFHLQNCTVKMKLSPGK